MDATAALEPGSPSALSAWFLVFSGLIRDYATLMWEIINNQNASAHPSGIRQVRQKVNELLLAKFGSKSIPDATKQYYSEYFKLLAVCYADAIKHPEFVASEAQGVRNFAYYYTRKLGIDLKKFRLTDAGFQQI
jgi:hypothetical protein